MSLPGCQTALESLRLNMCEVSCECQTEYQNRKRKRNQIHLDSRRQFEITYSSHRREQVALAND